MQALIDLINSLPPEARALAKALAIPGAVFASAAFATFTARFF